MQADPIVVGSDFGEPRSGVGYLVLVIAFRQTVYLDLHGRRR